MTAPLLDLDGVSVHYPEKSPILRRTTGWMKAVEQVSLTITQGETLGLVGESGCGKTTLGRAVLGLRPLSAGCVRFRGQDIATLPRDARPGIRRRMQLVFQDPYTALDPSASIGASIRAGLDIHALGARADRRARVAQIMAAVGLDPQLADRYPHEFSGGMRQRAVIARALVVEPEFVVLDEPTSALDVSIQAQILNLLQELQRSFGLTYLFISHDLGVVQHMADRVAVMYLGRIVETAPVADLFAAPRHPYTRALLDAIPVADPANRKPPPQLVDDLPIKPGSGTDGGCLFRNRCPLAMPICAERTPTLAGSGAHLTACWLDPAQERPA